MFFNEIIIYNKWNFVYFNNLLIYLRGLSNFMYFCNINSLLSMKSIIIFPYLLNIFGNNELKNIQNFLLHMYSLNFIIF